MSTSNIIYALREPSNIFDARLPCEIDARWREQPIGAACAAGCHEQTDCPGCGCACHGKTTQATH